MKRLLLVLLFVVPSAALALDEEQGWFAFHPPGLDVRVSLPAEPYEEHRVTDTLIGEVETLVWKTDRRGEIFSMTSTHLPRLAMWFKSDDALYERARDKLLETMKGETLSYRQLNHPIFERELRYRLTWDGEPAYGRARFVLVGRDLIVLHAVTDRPLTGDAERFFSSLSLQQVSR